MACDAGRVACGALWLMLDVGCGMCDVGRVMCDV